MSVATGKKVRGWLRPRFVRWDGLHIRTVPGFGGLGCGCLLFLALVVGCSCRPTKTAKKPPTSQTLEEMEELRKKREAQLEEKPDFEILDLQVMPSDEPVQSTGVKPQSHVKPGHWFSAIQRMKANNFDFPKGDLEAECVNARVQPILLPGDFELLTTRGVSLPKGQEKHTDMVLVAPVPPSREPGDYSVTSRMYFMSRLRPRGGGRQLSWQSEIATMMSAAENHFVVLSERADNYQFLKNLRLVNPHYEGDMLLQPRIDYRIKLPKGTQRVDLSTHPLTWTTVAYVLWDDFDPDILSIAQQQAMLDWLHWGGQLIINGPKTLDRLSSSFLGEYLPARVASTTTLADSQLRTLNRYWSFDEERLANRRDDNRPVAKSKLSVVDESSRPLCVDLELTDSGQFVEQADRLVAESRVGRGTIRVTAWNLPHPMFRQWTGYDSFWNGCLLRRPGRRFFSGQGEMITETFDSQRLDREDPRLTSQVRYFSRDATATTGRRARGGETESDAVALDHSLPSEAEDTYGLLGFAQDRSRGVAGWNDRSEVSRIAADALNESAGIEIPPARFVAQVLGIYLAILVPLNWLLFRLIRRVEWAWAAIPVISVAGAIAVLRATEFDIGFVRSRTELAVLEMQPGYDRAHVTRYIGFYTSLASSYELTGDDESSLMLPLAVQQRTESKVGLQFGNQVKMTGLNVLSNSTGMVHTEQMLNVGGRLELESKPEATTVWNRSNLNLQGVVIVQRISASDVRWAGIGELPAQSQRTVNFQILSTPQVEFTGWDASPTASRSRLENDTDDAVLNVRELLDLATAPERLGINETVLVGWTDKLVPGITVTPKASQVVARSVVVAQLQHANLPKPRRDVNSYAAMKQFFDSSEP